MAARSTTIRAEEENVLGFNQNIILLKHFREHLAVLSKPWLLELLSLANTMPLTNQDARAILKVGRNGAYYWLGKLTRLGMLEKRGQKYRISQYSMSLIAAASLTFRSLVLGKTPQTAIVDHDNITAWRTVLQTAAEGVELLYFKGRIDQSERSRQQKMINDLRLKLDDPSSQA